jgi:hypothetical protein
MPNKEAHGGEGGERKFTQHGQAWGKAKPVLSHLWRTDVTFRFK